jgi:hypothetical protein
MNDPSMLGDLVFQTGEYRTRGGLVAYVWEFCEATGAFAEHFGLEEGETYLIGTIKDVGLSSWDLDGNDLGYNDKLDLLLKVPLR